MKKNTYLFLIIACMSFAISACNHTKKDTVEDNTSGTKNFLVHYLDLQKIENPTASSFIDTLITKSDWGNVAQSYISNSVKLIYLPVKYNSNNIGIVFLYNTNTEQIYYSHIAEVQSNASSVAASPQIVNNQTVKVIADFYRCHINDFTGSIKAFSITNNFLWEFGYVHGTKKFEKTITASADHQAISIGGQIKTNSVQAHDVKSDGCLDWYIVTWYDDGSSDWLYIGTSCDSYCLETIGIAQDSLRVKSDCAGGRGGGGGSSPAINTIKNKVKDPCLKKLISNLQNSNKINNAIGKILQSVFGVNDNINLTFEENNNLKNSNGETLNGQAMSFGNGNYTVTLNANALNIFSQERKTLTIMHEVLHDYFYSRYNNPTINGHTRMVTAYIDKMASSLEDLYPAMRAHHDVTLALCLEDLNSSVGSAANQINLSVFNNVVLECGLSLGDWERVANQAKYAGSEFASQAPCVVKGN